MAYAYLARHYCQSGDYVRVHIVSEGVFSTFEGAEAFIADKVREESGDELSAEDLVRWPEFTREAITENFRYDIIAFEMDHYSPDEAPKQWLYDGVGNLIRVFVDDADQEDALHAEDTACEGKYHCGDLVLLRANLWNPLAPSDRDIIGVVAWGPVPLSEWINRGGLASEWGSHYMVDFINTDGYLDHCHIEEPGIQPFEGKLPDNLQFLQTLSDHYLGKRKIRPSVLDDLYNSKIFVEKVRMFTEEDLENPNEPRT